MPTSNFLACFPCARQPYVVNACSVLSTLEIFRIPCHRQRKPGFLCCSLRLLDTIEHFLGIH